MTAAESRHRYAPARQPWQQIAGLSATAIACTLLFTSAAARTKSDRIELDNGDKVTGEIKSVSQGLLSLSTDAMGTISLEWAHITRLDSEFAFQVELTDGRILIGTLSTGQEKPARLHIEDLAVTFDQVARVAPSESKVLDRFKGSASIGFSFTKSSESQQGNIAFDTIYRSPKTHADFSFSSISVQDSGGDHDRDDLSFVYRRPQPNRWYGAGLFQAQRNEDLGIELRISAGGGYGRYLSQATDREIALTGGIIATREWDVGLETSESEIEGFIGLDANYYVYDSPKISLGSSLIAYPGLSKWGSIRGDLDLHIRWELVKDFHLQLQIYGSYDNKPPDSENSDTTDYGLVTSLVYEF